MDDAIFNGAQEALGAFSVGDAKLPEPPVVEPPKPMTIAEAYAEFGLEFEDPDERESDTEETQQGGDGLETLFGNYETCILFLFYQPEGGNR